MISEHDSDGVGRVDRREVERAFAFACERHADQRRRSGEEFVSHPVEVAKICAGLRLDTETLCAALLHDTVEDTSASVEEVAAGVRRGRRPPRRRRHEADRDHVREPRREPGRELPEDDGRDGRGRAGHPDQARRPPPQHADDSARCRSRSRWRKARETLEIYAPLAHRLGIHAIKWELEDLAFQILHPRKYEEIKKLVAQQRDEREEYVDEAGDFLGRELLEVGIEAQISGRAKHFYSIYSKMTKKGREFNEIYDLTAMRVIVGSVKDCYGAIGVIHALWKPLPGRFKDFIATPKMNLYQTLHTTVIGPQGQPLEIQIRTAEMHELAEYGVAAHVIYKEGTGKGARPRTRAARR